MTNNPNQVINDLNVADKFFGLKGPTKPSPDKELPLEEDIYRVIKELFLDKKVTLDEFKAYFLFLESYFDDIWRTIRPNDYNNLTTIVEMMLEYNRTLSEMVRKDMQTHNILYTKKKNTKPKDSDFVFLTNDFNYMYRLLTGLTEAGVIVRAPRTLERERYPQLFNKTKEQILKNEEEIDGAVQIREKKVIDKRKKEAKLLSFQPAPTYAEHQKWPMVVRDKTTMSFISAQEIEPRRLLYIMRLFFLPKEH